MLEQGRGSKSCSFVTSIVSGVWSVDCSSILEFWEEGFYWVDVSQILGHECYYSPRFIYSTIHSVTTFYSHSYHNTSSNTFFSIIPSIICLSGT